VRDRTVGLRWLGRSAHWAVPFVLPIVVLLAAASQGAEVVKELPAGPGPLDNPLKGWCPYVDAGPIHQPYSMVFLYVPWSRLEPEEGVYRFEQWEREAWGVPEARGRHVVFRVWVDYPGQPSGMPRWLVKEGVKMRRYTAYGGGWSPDYDDPAFVQAAIRLIEALGKRYNRHPRVAFVQMGLLGHWGEWHTYPRTELFASEATQLTILSAYRRAFPDKHVMARYARGPAARARWLGFHDDFFPEDTDNGQSWSFLAGLRRAGLAENWRVAPRGGEMVPGQARRWLGRDYETTLRMVEAAHMSWIGPYCPALEEPPNEEFSRRCAELVRRMGYQFRLTRVRYNSPVRRGGHLRVEVEGVNEGVAPFYYRWPVRLALIGAGGEVAREWDTRADVRRWLPGTFRLVRSWPVDLMPAQYDLALGIVDPWTGRPAVRFANDCRVVDGWCILGTVRVE